LSDLWFRGAMGTTGWIILIVVIAVIVIGVAVALMGNKRTAAKREEAESLRNEAAERTASVEASRREADEQAARAEVARAEAARAEEAALQAQQGVQVEEARVEDQVRAADRVDPDVDTRSDDYRPTTPATGTTAGSTTSTGTTYDDTVAGEHTIDDPESSRWGRSTDETATVDPAHDQETAPRRTDPA
jgi:FtsZ-interacting cell division protein ZipA